MGGRGRSRHHPYECGKGCEPTNERRLRSFLILLPLFTDCEAAF